MVDLNVVDCKFSQPPSKVTNLPFQVRPTPHEHMQPNPNKLRSSTADDQAASCHLWQEAVKNIVSRVTQPAETQNLEEKKQLNGDFSSL